MRIGVEGGTPRHAAGGRQLRWRHWRESRYENETAKISLLKNKDSLVLLNARFDPDNLENGETDGWTADVEIALDVDPLSNLDAFAQSSMNSSFHHWRTLEVLDDRESGITKRII